MRCLLSFALFSCSALLFCVATNAEEKDVTSIGTVDIEILNATGGPVFFFVSGKHGTPGRIDLPNDGDYARIRFVADGNERALDSFEGSGKKVQLQFTFIPDKFSIILTASRVEKVTKALGERAKRQVKAKVDEKAAY